MSARLAALAVAAALAACSPQIRQDAAAALAPCAGPSGELEPHACSVQAAGQTLNVRYGELPAGVAVGSVSVDVLGEDGAVLQTLMEQGVSAYLPVGIEDVDGDGRADILIPRDQGNVNTTHGVWIFSGRDGRYERVGEVSGVGLERSADGYIAVPARASAASWNVQFYRLDETGLHPVAGVNVDGEETPRGVRATCTLSEAPELETLGLSRDAAQAKFCAEPAAQVFEP